MTTSATYAQALYELTENAPRKGTKYLKNLRGVLTRRGHEKLFPKIFSDYQKLMLKEKRAKAHIKTTPTLERTRLLLELYRRLITTP